MAHTNSNGIVEPGLKAASAILPKAVVKLDTTAGQVVPCATTTDRPLGLVGVASAAVGEAVTVYGPGCIVKAVANASVGFGAEVGIASSNNSLGPITGASGVSKWSVGTTREAGAAGETISVFVSPRQLSNLI